MSPFTWSQSNRSEGKAIGVRNPQDICKANQRVAQIGVRKAEQSGFVWRASSKRCSTLVLYLPPPGYWQLSIATSTLIGGSPSRSRTLVVGLYVRQAKNQGTQAENFSGRIPVAKWLRNIWRDDQGQDVAEYAVMLAVILVIVVGTIRLIGSNANNVFSSVGSSIQ